jgi:hypothetical protein
MRNSKWTLALAILATAVFVTSAVARDAESRGNSQIEGSGIIAGVIVNEGGAAAVDGDLIYGNANNSGYYYRPYPGYRDYDDIHIEAGPNGNLVGYTIAVFGSTVSGSDAGSPYDVTLELYTDVLGDPSIGQPDAPIPGTQCQYVGIPTGSFLLECTTAGGISLPDGFWMAFETSTNNSGWRIADFNDCPTTGPPGFSEDFWAQEDFIGAPGLFSFYFFGGCPGNPSSSFVATVVAEGQPWACCDTGTFDCVNVQETACAGVFTEGTLCNNLAQPCSEAGACCDTATGTCSNTFASLCDGFLEVFTAGETCPLTTCVVPENVPTLTQWGMIGLTVLLLTGLTIKFGRRRTVTA